MSIQMMEMMKITKKRTQLKAKKMKISARGLIIITDKSQYYNNICKDTEDVNKQRKTRRVFQKLSKIRRKFQT